MHQKYIFCCLFCFYFNAFSFELSILLYIIAKKNKKREKNLKWKSEKKHKQCTGNKSRINRWAKNLIYKNKSAAGKNERSIFLFYIWCCYFCSTTIKYTGFVYLNNNEVPLAGICCNFMHSFKVENLHEFPCLLKFTKNNQIQIANCISA